MQYTNAYIWNLAEKATAPHSSTLAWKVPYMEEPGRMQPMGSLRVRHDWVTSLWLFTFMHWRRKWQPTPVFLSGESQWWQSWCADMYGVTQSWTRLKRLSSSSSSSMKFRKMVKMILYARQQKRHSYKEQTLGFCGRRRWWDDLREQHWNMYISICEIDDQSKFDARNRTLKASALGQPWGMGWEGGGRGVWDGGTQVHPWQIHVYVWQNHHNIVK